ncbi:hypothetical protein GCM10027275_53400 [Rhabdobacter roseus]|uniref:Translocation protein TolB n=1 Tax=Rhabdobacter roseus TaxID=1655419 RepID=A0A840U349_9BACT|nr:hypothetical protein [Rhabdobacter roseus]MBB5286269.1 hypothetical protein [Rhabdobacter roseus]
MKLLFLYKAALAAVFFVILLPGQTAHAQRYPSQERFGKNRVQYRTFDWKVLKSSNFEIYHYQGGTNLARLAAQFAESEFDRITEVLGYTPYNRIKIFLYNSPGELMQSNMGLATFGDLDDQELDLAQSRLEIAFTGDQLSFRKELVKEISLLFVYDMLYGGNLKDALQSSLLLTLPEWFMQGIAAYIAEGWTPELSDYMRDLSNKRQLKKPGLLTGADATLVGQSIWNYIAERYGRDNISNILNLTRIIRTEQTSITSTLGIPSYTRFLRDWREYYVNVSKQAAQHYREPSPTWQYRLHEANTPGSNAIIKISSDKKWLAISELYKERYRVQIFNNETGRRMVIRQGTVVTNNSRTQGLIPLIGWTRNNALAVLVEEGGRPNFFLYENLDTKKPKIRLKRTIRGLDQIVDMDISEDGTMLAVSADKGGQNDLYMVSVARASAIQLTNDLYDDLTPRFVAGSARRIAFASNRPTDSLGTDKGTYKTIQASLSIFEHDGSPRAATVGRLVDSLGTIMRPIYVDEAAVYFLSDVKGISNLFKFDRTTGTTAQLTDYLYSLKNADLKIGSGGSLAYIRLNDGNLMASYQDRLDLNASLSTPGLGSSARSNAGVAAPNAGQPNAEQPDTTQESARQTEITLKEGEVDTDNYQFDPDMLKAFENRQRRGTLSSVPSLTPKPRRRENIAIRGPYDYKGLFVANDATSDWRIDPIRGFGYAQSISMNDLLENHVLKAGFFVSTNFRNNDLYAEYNNYKYRVDFGARVDRRSLFFDVEGAAQKYRFNQVSLSASYPLSTTTRFTVTPTYTLTRLVDVYLLAEPDHSSQYGGINSEFVFDNSRVNGMNMIEGTRFKVRYENYMGISRASDSFNRISVDLRRYQKIHRDLILAARLAFSHSGGRAPKQNIMGGMENWILNRKDAPNTTNPLAFGPGIDNRDIFFAEFATNLRGFNLNRLAGTSYVLANAELRIPLIKYIYRGPITSNFLRNFQVIGFTDIGTAWTGRGPFSQENSLNTEIVGGGSEPFRASVTNFRNPYLMGYGVGARTMLFGFYVKFDYAWGVDNGITNKAIPYVTLGYDF